MTVANPKPAVELEDCVREQDQHLNHILMPKVDACENQGYQRLRSASWVFSTPQPGTQPLYRCYSETETSHFAANSEDCDRAAKMEALLGYDLEQ